MAHYDVRTGMVSHRHPFRGFGTNGQSGLAAPTTTPPATPSTKSPTTPSAISTIPWGGAALSGGIMGLVAYGVCSGFDVPSNKATGIGVTIGLMTAVGQIASALLKGWADDVMKTAGATTPTTTTTTPG